MQSRFRQVSFTKFLDDVSFDNLEKSSLAIEGEMGVWRVENKKFVISLTREEDSIKVLYIQFVQKEELFRPLLRSMGVNTDELTWEKKRSWKDNR